MQLLVEDPRKGRVAIVEAGAMPSLRERRSELLHHFAHRSAEEARELWSAARRSERDDEIAGALFIGGMAELISRWLDGSLEATPEEIVDAAVRGLLGLYA